MAAPVDDTIYYGPRDTSWSSRQGHETKHTMHYRDTCSRCVDLEKQISELRQAKVEHTARDMELSVYAGGMSVVLVCFVGAGVFVYILLFIAKSLS